MTTPNWTDVLFDLDGTLIDSGPGVINSAKYALAAMGCPPLPRQELDRFMGPPLEHSFQHIAGLSQTQARRAIEKYREYYAPRGIKENTLYPGMAALLAGLFSHKKTLYVVTSKPAPYAEQILQDLGIAKYFTALYGSTLEDENSPKANSIRTLLHERGILPAAAVMVGDRYFDIEAAKQTGLASIGVLFGGYGTRQEMETAGADYIADTVEHLGQILAGAAA